jgi:hypothetical protein
VNTPFTAIAKMDGREDAGIERKKENDAHHDVRNAAHHGKEKDLDFRIENVEGFVEKLPSSV